jgi:type II secretory pathway pseudopilin PulG
MTRFAAIVAALLLLAAPALAQAIDPRVQKEAVAALQAQIAALQAAGAYQEAVIRAKDEDAGKLAAWWAELWKALPPAPSPE